MVFLLHPSSLAVGEPMVFCLVPKMLCSCALEKFSDDAEREMEDGALKIVVEVLM